MSTTTQPPYSELIRTLRDPLGITQERLAQKLGVSFPSVDRWERGHAQPSRMARGLLRNFLVKLKRSQKNSVKVKAEELLQTYFPEEI